MVKYSKLNLIKKNKNSKICIPSRNMRVRKQQNYQDLLEKGKDWFQRSSQNNQNDQNSKLTSKLISQQKSQDTVETSPKKYQKRKFIINLQRQQINLRNKTKIMKLFQNPIKKSKPIAKISQKSKVVIQKPKLSLNSPAYIVCDSKLNIILGRKTKRQMAIASLTKLLNLLTCLQVMRQYNFNLQKMMEIPALTNRRQQSSAKLLKGDKMTLRNLLYAMILPSGNDAAQAIAIIFGGLLTRSKDPKQQKQAYIHRMKSYGQKIGMKCLKLLDEKGYALNTATPYQIILLLKQISSDKQAIQFLKPQSIRAQVTDINGRTRGCSWTTTNLLLQQGFYGKTGHAKNRTFSFATIKYHKQNPYYICVLGSVSETGRFSDTKYLLKHAIRQL